MAETKNKVEYVPGFFLKRHPKQPEFVLCSGSIRRADLMMYLERQKDDYINIKIVKGKDTPDGKKTASVQIDTWKPDPQYQKRPDQQKTEHNIADEFKVPEMEYADIQYSEDINADDIPF